MFVFSSDVQQKRGMESIWRDKRKSAIMWLGFLIVRGLNSADFWQLLVRENRELGKELATLTLDAIRR